MLLIGIFTLAMMLASPASAEPVSLTVAVAAIVGSTFVAQVIVTVVTIAVSLALSFVASALLKPPNRSGGPATAMQQTANKVTVKEAAGVRPLIYGRTRVSGKYIFFKVTGGNKNLHAIIVFAGHQTNGYHEVWVNNESVTFDGNGLVKSGQYAEVIRVAAYIGSANQVADPNLVRDSNGDWTAADRLQGIAYLYVTFFWDKDKFRGGGLPNITAVVNGRADIYDPRSMTAGYTSNPALCLANYLCDPVHGLGINYATEIDETALIAAANACDEAVPRKDGAFEARYSCDGMLLTSMTPQDIIAAILSSMHGRLVYDGEKYKIIAGVYQSPTLTLTDDDLRAGPKIQTLVSRRDLFNAVKGTYLGPENDWQEGDFPPVVSSAFAAIDGATLWKDIQLPMTSSPHRAHRIAKIDLFRVRQPISGTFPCKLSAWRVQTGDTIQWTSERYGWLNKPFEVVSVRFAVEDGALGVDLELRETAAAIYDYNVSEENTVDFAPNTTLPNAARTAPPSNLRVTESLYVARDGGGVKTRVTLTFDPSPDAFVNLGGKYLGLYRLVGGKIWTLISTTTDQLSIDWPDAVPGVYDFMVYAENYRGVGSPALIVRQSIAGLSAAPAPPRNLSVVSSGNALALATWTPPTELDVSQGGHIVFRHSPLLTGAAWADGTTIGQASFPAIGGVAYLPLKSGTYMAKFRDSTGQWSTAVNIVQRQHSVLSFTTLTGGTLDEAPDFEGDKVNCFADAGSLSIVGNDDFDSVVDVDALVTWDWPGGVITEDPMALGARPRAIVLGDPAAGTALGDREQVTALGQLLSSQMVLGDTGAGIVLGRPRMPSAYYDWSTPIDLGLVKNCRLTVTLQSFVENVFDDFDSRSGEVDSWPSWDGDVDGDEGDAWTTVQTTDDDPANPAATWADWRRIDSGEFEARGFRLRTYLNSKDAAMNIQITELSALVDGIV